LRTLDKQKLFPWIVNVLLVMMQKIEWPGKHKFYINMSQHYPHKVIIHNIDNREFCVPIGEWCFWLEKGPENYYLDEFLPFCNVLNQLNEPFTFLDLGADIGTVSSLVVSRCCNVENVIAFEPNPKAFQILKSNLDNFGIPTECVNSAVSDFEGSVSFCADPDRINDHEGYIDSNQKGDTPVTSIDHWVSNALTDFKRFLVVKIDVEGQEIPALLGATKVIQDADKVVLLIEVHPDVLARTNNTPDDLFVEAERIRGFNWVVPLLGDTKVDRSLPFFKQVPEGQYDIIGTSVD
jgi:FkbM family methyltransferase